MGIAEQIKRSLDTISNWSADWETSFFGVAFNRCSRTVFDELASRYASKGEWLNVARVKRRAELCDYSSPTLDDAVKSMLTNVEMFSTAKIPKNMPSDVEYPFYPTYHVMLSGYRWAKELNHETTKWDANAALQKLFDFRIKQPDRLPFYKCNFDTGKAERLHGGTWAEDAALAGCFMKINEAIDVDISYFTREWWGFNRFWDGTHFKYSVELPNWEMSAGAVFQRIAKLFIHTVGKGWNIGRVPVDIMFRFLKDGWDSPQWGGYKVVVRHNPYDDERRLDATLDSLAVLHMFYEKYAEPMKSQFREMLAGEKITGFAEGLLQSDLFDPKTNRFRASNKQSLSDTATCWGCASLFLSAIIPESGRLAIPIAAEGTENYEHNFFNYHHFEFDYDRRRVKIPVYAGKISFRFGDTVVSQNFPYDGIYTINFSDNWNSVVAVNRIAGLEAVYLEPPRLGPTTMEILTATMVTAFATVPIYTLSKTLVEKVKEEAE